MVLSVLMGCGHAALRSWVANIDDKFTISFGSGLGPSSISRNCSEFPKRR